MLAQSCRQHGHHMVLGLGRDHAAHGLEHIGRLVIRVVVGCLLQLTVHHLVRQECFQVLDVLNRALQDAQLMQVIFVYARGDQVLQLQDLVVDALAPPALNGRV